MKYINAKNILPVSLLEELQDHIQGKLLYIPKRSTKAGWGEINGSRRKYDRRNERIKAYYINGMSIKEIAGRYHLSEDSIRKITRRAKVQGNSL